MINVSDKTGIVKNNITISNKITEGVIVLSVKDSSAASSILKKGDIITKINHIKVKDIAYLRYELFQHQSGDTITITYLRNGKESTKKITLN
jgi:serine protease Do